MGALISALHIDYEKTYLREVRETTLIGWNAHQGDGGESISWLCYTISQP
jgi:hypothetical protein